MTYCNTCETYHDAFGSTTISADLRDIWSDWEKHIMRFHPDYINYNIEGAPSSSEMKAVGEIWVDRMLERSSIRTLYVID